jgi:MoaA/NifB/PqqE/SkfB family radical SAM enzyme
MAWNHQFIDPTGRVKPCCRFEEKHRRKDNNLQDKTLTEVFTGEWMDTVRQKMILGERVDGCTRCYQEEDAGKRSLRQRYNESTLLPIQELVDINSPKLRWIELAISNDCNLACRMCDSRYSWKWFKEEQALFGKTHNTKEHSESDISNVFPFLQDLVHLKFTGGEPLLTKSHWTLIDKLLKERDCSDIFLNYSTNCTLTPKPSWVDRWNKFKYVEFALSFDSCDPLESEYIRWPAKFSTTEPVTKRFLELNHRDNYRVLLRSTISILNVWNLPETLLWWIKHDPREHKIMNPTHLTHPGFLSVTVLPRNLKNLIEEKFNNYKDSSISNHLTYIKNYMNSKDDSSLLPNLIEYLDKTDRYRSQSFIKAYPQFKDIMV